MITIVFEDDQGGELRLTVQGPCRLLDVCDELGAPVVFGCRAARCGSCAVQFTAGSELVCHPQAQEQELLMQRPLGAHGRYACGVWIGEGAGCVRVRSHPQGKNKA